MKSLKDLVSKTELTQLSDAEKSLKITGITSNSKEVKPGMLFVATRGTTVDGHQFIASARSQGAVMVVGEESRAEAHYLRVSDSKLALARFAAAFYDHPSHQMKMVGVTGTSGKTTTSYLIESILRAAGHQTGLIGTIEFRYAGKVLDSTHTTPGAVELQRLLAEMRDAGCTAVAMEVSSHALKQHRAAMIAFDAMIFTNLTPEHLDFHPDMEDYFGAKAMLFTEFAQTSRDAGKTPVASICVDSEWGERLVKEVQAQGLMKTVMTFGTSEKAALNSSALSVSLGGVSGEVQGVKIESSLTAQFNVSNLLGATGAALGMGITSEDVTKGLKALKSVPGRLEKIPNEKGIHVFVDYAHKSDALEKVLQTLTSMKGAHRLITVFGCGGDRDRTKRPVMGRTAEKFSDLVIVTSDNPRTEDPLAIIDEILKGMTVPSRREVEPDRKKAITRAIQLAKAGDIVLIAGKGHETYQIIGTRKNPFDDRKVAQEAFQ